MLRDISIRVYKNEDRPSFQFYTGGIELLYFRHLPKMKLGLINIVNLYFTNQDHKVVSSYKTILNVNARFDFSKFEKLQNNYDKKRMILEAMHLALTKLASEHNWDSNPFESAYHECLQSNLLCTWFLRGKLFRSPNRKFHFGLWHCIDVGKYEVWEILYDEKKEEIARRLCFSDNASIFFVGYAGWEDQNDHFIYRFNGPPKKFYAAVNDLIENIPLPAFTTTSQFFKS